MSRLLLEICPENAGNGEAAGLPPILICSAQDETPISMEGLAGARPLVLRWQNGGYALEQPSGPAPAALGIGQWHNAEGWRLRVTQALPGENDLAIAGANPSWAAPELRITTYDGERVKKLRCMLPVEEGSQLVVGRDGAKADLVVEDEHVSRSHLRFFVREGKPLVEDLGSRWGSKLNDQPLTDPRPLAHGDEIRLGKSSIQYVCYWDLLPPPGAKPATTAVAAEEPRAAERVKVESPKAEPAVAKVTDARLPEVVPVPPPKPPTEVTPVAAREAAVVAPSRAAPKPLAKRNLAGFDLGGAIVLVLLLLAGMAYLAYHVFHP